MLQVLQLRTKGFDDAVRAEMKKGLAQVLILGAGYDCRALRLAPAAPKQTNFIEIDMPPSQTAKRESLAVSLSPPGAPLGGLVRCKASVL